MALYPCQRHQQPFQGEARNAYLTIYDGDRKAAFRFVVCPECLVDLSSDWVQLALFRDEKGDWNLPDPDRGLDGHFNAQEAPTARFRR